MFDHYHGLAHIAVRTLDVEKSIEFYEKIGGKAVLADILGTERGDKLMAMVEFAGITIELIQVFDPVEPGIIPHFAIYVDNLLDVVQEIAAEFRFRSGHVRTGSGALVGGIGPEADDHGIAALQFMAFAAVTSRVNARPG